MSIFDLFKSEPEPRSVNDMSNSHLVIAISASVQSSEEAKLGTIAASHLAEIAQRHFTASNVLDSILEAHEKAG